MHRAGKKPKAAACMEATAHQLAKCIRFPMLTNDFLHFVVSQVCYRFGQPGMLLLGSARYVTIEVSQVCYPVGSAGLSVWRLSFPLPLPAWTFEF